MASAQTLDELARMVERAVTEEGQINKEREAEFLRERDNQRNLLAQARAELARQEQRSDQLKTEYDENERASGRAGDRACRSAWATLASCLVSCARPSGDIQSTLDDSMVSAQFPGRGDFLSELAQRKELPNVGELRRIWSAMVTEIAESGKVVKFNAPVELSNGEKRRA